VFSLPKKKRQKLMHTPGIIPFELQYPRCPENPLHYVNFGLSIMCSCCQMVWAMEKWFLWKVFKI